ncbi:ABC transporter permease [Undibacterium sp. Ji50W]|uniref:ABC transporter permease n=1 Tax=Undibacterium sp. Ji50W TaxID=3413041 RepID=UPI003BF312E0
MKKNWRVFGAGLIVPIVLILVWHTFSTQGWVNPQMLPAPLDVLKKWIEYGAPREAFNPAVENWLSWIVSGEMVRDTLGSMYRVFAGFFIGTSLALPLGLIMGTNQRVYTLLNPLIQLHRPIPPIAFTPLAILWFGLGDSPAIFLISIGAFFPVLMNTIAGVHHVDSIYIRAARNLGASQFTMFSRVILPAAVPYILSGVRIGIGSAFICVIIAEMLAVNNGLGFRIQEAREYFWTDKIIAGMYTIGFLGLAIDIAMNKLNNYLLRWHRGLES